MGPKRPTLLSHDAGGGGCPHPDIPTGSHHVSVASTTRCQSELSHLGSSDSFLMGYALVFLPQQDQGCLWGGLFASAWDPFFLGSAPPLSSLDHSGTSTTSLPRMGL